MDDDHDLVADIDSDTPIRIVKFKFFKWGKAPGPDNRHHHLVVLSLSMTFYLLHTNRLHPNYMKISYPSYATETWQIPFSYN